MQHVLINTFVLIKQYCTIVQYVLHDRAINVVRSCKTRCTNVQYVLHDGAIRNFSCIALRHSFLPHSDYWKFNIPLKMIEQSLIG